MKVNIGIILISYADLERCEEISMNDKVYEGIYWRILSANEIY